MPAPIAYVCLLRGINVSGQKIIAMERLRRSFEAMGLKGVRTYVQSGNVVFHGPAQPAEALCRRISARILKDFGFEVPTLVRTVAQVERTLQRNPFLNRKGVDPAKLHVTFLAGKAKRADLGKLAAVPSGADRFECVGSEIYLHCPRSYGGTKLSNTVIEKHLGLQATTRNWKTVNALVELARELA